MERTNHVPLIHDLLEAINAHDVARVAHFHAVDYEGLDVSRATLRQGREGVCEELSEWWSAFPDLQFVIQDVVVQPGRLAFLWTAEGIHEGVFLRVPPTGRRIEVCGVTLLTVQDGKIARGLYLWDMAGLLRSMKLLPDLPGDGQGASQAAMLSSFLMNL